MIVYRPLRLLIFIKTLFCIGLPGVPLSGLAAQTCADIYRQLIQEYNYSPDQAIELLISENQPLTKLAAKKIRKNFTPYLESEIERGIPALLTVRSIDLLLHVLGKNAYGSELKKGISSLKLIRQSYYQDQSSTIESVLAYPGHQELSKLITQVRELGIPILWKSCEELFCDEFQNLDSEVRTDEMKRIVLTQTFNHIASFTNRDGRPTINLQKDIINPQIIESLVHELTHGFQWYYWDLNLLLEMFVSKIRHKNKFQQTFKKNRVKLLKNPVEFLNFEFQSDLAHLKLISGKFGPKVDEIKTFMLIEHAYKFSSFDWVYFIDFLEFIHEVSAHYTESVIGGSDIGFHGRYLNFKGKNRYVQLTSTNVRLNHPKLNQHLLQTYEFKASRYLNLREALKIVKILNQNLKQ